MLITVLAYARPDAYSFMMDIIWYIIYARQAIQCEKYIRLAGVKILSPDSYMSLTNSHGLKHHDTCGPLSQSGAFAGAWTETSAHLN
jgi:hypothetical protein